MAKQITSGWIKKAAAQYMNRCTENNQMPTVCGLAYSIGFETKEDFLNFRGDAQSRREIKRTLLLLEEKLEMLLHEKDGFQAAKFILSTQFSGWGDRLEKPVTPVYILDNVVQDSPFDKQMT